jgi:hypothetical protein
MYPISTKMLAAAVQRTSRRDIAAVRPQIESLYRPAWATLLSQWGTATTVSGSAYGIGTPVVL